MVKGQRKLPFFKTRQAAARKKGRQLGFERKVVIWAILVLKSMFYDLTQKCTIFTKLISVNLFDTFQDWPQIIENYTVNL